MATSSLFSAITATVKGGAKVGTIIRKHLQDNDTASIVECADAIEAAYPVKKDADGKDANRDIRNDCLRVLRMGLMRAGREVGQRITIKKIEGVYTVVVEALEGDNEPVAVDSETGEPVASVGKAMPDPDSKAADKLWEAVDLVLAHLDNPAILSAIRSGLEALKAKG